MCAIGTRAVESAARQHRGEGLRQGVHEVHLPVPLRQLLWTVPARVPDGPRRLRQAAGVGRPGSEQHQEPRVLAQADCAHRVRCRGRSNQLHDRPQPVSSAASSRWIVRHTHAAQRSYAVGSATRHPAGHPALLPF